MSSILFLCVLIGIPSFGVLGDQMHEANMLYGKLLSEYNKDFIPTPDQNTTVQLQLGASLINIIEVDERIGSMTTQLWMRMMWRDFRLQWDPSEHGALSILNMDMDHLWKPDIMLYNSAREHDNMLVKDIKAIVFSSGDVLWIPPVVAQSLCSMDMTYFPFDTQRCTLKFGSWVYHGEQLSLGLYEGQASVDLNDYVPHIEWNIKSSNASVEIKYYACCAEPFMDMQFVITMERRLTYYSYMYIGPAVMLALLTPFLFVFPPTSNHKFAMGGAMLISMVILAGNLEAVYPSARGDMPILGRYYTSVFVLLVLALFLSAIVVNLATKARAANVPPKIIKVLLVDGLARVLCVSGKDSGMTDTEDNGDDDNLRIVQHSGSSSVQWLVVAAVIDRVAFFCSLGLTLLFICIYLAPY